MRKLKTCFVDGEGIDHRSLSQLHILICGGKIITTGWQGESIHPVVLRGRVKIVITSNQRVPRIDRIVETRAEVSVSARHQKPLT